MKIFKITKNILKFCDHGVDSLDGIHITLIIP